MHKKYLWCYAGTKKCYNISNLKRGGISIITIIDYRAGNIASVKRALDFLGIENCISNDPVEIVKASKLIFPGVGHAATAMEYLKSTGIGDALKNRFNIGVPILGICLGSQIILSNSAEGDTECLGLIQGETKKFIFSEASMKVPHMGWNGISIKSPHFVMDGIDATKEFYFVHSYYVQPANEESVIATCDYGISFPAVIGHKNLIAMQFHPEKSGETGLRLLERFSIWEGSSW